MGTEHTEGTQVKRFFSSEGRAASQAEAVKNDAPDVETQQLEQESKTVFGCSNSGDSRGGPCSTCSAPSMCMRTVPEGDNSEVKMFENGGSREERLKAARRMRLIALNFKDGEVDDDAFLCAIERKVHPGTDEVCADCRGGCAREGELPGLLEIEGMTEDTFGGKVLDSGYSDALDMFVVNVERKDGQVIEVYLDGTGEVNGWHKLPDYDKDAPEVASDLIGMSQAVDAAMKSLDGAEVEGLGVDTFEGIESYVVHMKGENGNQYDVFVSLDGKVLGYDEYEATDLPEGEAKAEEEEDVTTAAGEGEEVEVKADAESEGEELLTIDPTELMEFEMIAEEAELREKGLL